MKRVGCAIASVVLAACGAGRAAAEPMDGATIEATFPGMSLTGIYDDGSRFSEIYAPDGTISYVDVANGHLTGEWEVRGDTFCTTYQDGQGACLTAEQVSSNCYIFAEPPRKGAEPALGVVIGWNAIEPSTCEIPAAPAPALPRGK